MNAAFPRMMTLLRKERGISQKKAATDLHISQALLSHYEKGIRECGLDFVVAAADYYGVSCDYLLGRTGIVLDGVAAGREDVGMDRDAFGLGHAHVVLGLGIAPRLGRTAVAELFAVALFVADDEHGLMIDIAITLTGNVSTGNDHGRVVSMLALTAYLSVIVVDVFKDVTKTDALGVTHDAHLVHGGELIFKLAFHEEEEILQGGHLSLGLSGRAVLKASAGFAEAGLQRGDIFLMLAGEDILDIGQSISELMQLFFPFHKNDSLS